MTEIEIIVDVEFSNRDKTLFGDRTYVYKYVENTGIEWATYQSEDKAKAQVFQDQRALNMVGHDIDPDSLWVRAR